MTPEPQGRAGVRVLPVGGMPEVGPGDDLSALIAGALRNNGIRLGDGDVVVVTQKIVSKAEGRVVPEGEGGKADWVRRETRRVVARRRGLVIAETSHGFVCAGAGVDASNVATGFVSLLPEDPDASAERIRAGLEGLTRAHVAIVVTDTFGRPWRSGLVNVAIGCAGLPSLIDLRGTRDAMGRILEVTVVALADEVAAASGLVMGKSDQVPVAVLRGVRWDEPPSPASTLIRGQDGDLFRESPLEAVRACRTAERFGPGEVPPDVVLEAVAAADTSPEDGGGRPLFVLLRPGPLRRRVAEAVDRPGLVAGASVVVVPSVAVGAGAGASPVLGGALLQRLLLSLRAHGLAWRWAPAPSSPAGDLGRILGLDPGWIPVGVVAAGPMPPEGSGEPSFSDPDPLVAER